MEKSFDRLNWIKDLVRAEQQMEESGVVDYTSGFDPALMIQKESTEFLNLLKNTFVESSTSFNQLKSSNLGRIKIYGISNTEADFMLFRNGFKLIFSLKEPGVIGIRFSYVAAPLVMMSQSNEAQNKVSQDEDILQAQWGAFGDVIWTYHNQPVKVDYLVRYYMTKFIKESAK